MHKPQFNTHFPKDRLETVTLCSLSTALIAFTQVQHTLTHWPITAQYTNRLERSASEIIRCNALYNSAITNGAKFIQVRSFLLWI